jgi:hypothetical protein
MRPAIPSGAAARSQIIEILDDLFWLINDHLGGEETRYLFKSIGGRAAHRPPNIAFKQICLDTYDAMKAQGVPESNIPSAVEKMWMSYRNTAPGTIARQIRNFVKQRKRGTN